MPETATTLVMAPNWLGDAVMALPAIADLKRHAGAARVVVAARAAVAALFAMSPDVDGVVTLEWRGRPFSRAGLAADVARLKGTGARAAVLFPNSFSSAWLTREAGIPQRAGYARDWRRWLLTRPVPVPRASAHQGAYYQHLVSALGVPNGPLEPRLDVPETDVSAARALLQSRGWRGAGPLAVLAPGAAYGTAKRWPPRSFAAVASSLVARHAASCVLVGGAADAATTRLVRDLVDAAARSQVFDLAGATTLGTLAGLLRLGHACVSNDSGAMHVAGAVGIPLVALFGPTREHETAPLAPLGHPARVLTHPVWCRPCMLRECPIDHRCMTGLRSDVVLHAVGEALSRTAPGADRERRP